MTTTGHPIDIRHLTKDFGSFRALDGVEMSVEQGTIHGFLGPNGAGKSTTIRIALGMYRPSGGQVRVLGLDPATEPARVNAQVSYVPGDVALWPNLTGQQVLDVLAQLRATAPGGAPRQERRERELIERLALDPSKKVSSYSTGNRQKVMLVAAFAAPTPLLVLDEPTAGLDPLMEQVFAQCVREAAASGRTILLSSHLLAEVDRLCTDVTIVADGRVVESGSLKDLRHIASLEVSIEGPQSMVQALSHQLPDTQVEDGTLTAQVPRAQLPQALGRIAASGATDVTVAPASLESLFLRHYRVGAR